MGGSGRDVQNPAVFHFGQTISKTEDTGIVSNNDNTTLRVTGDLIEDLHDLMTSFAVERRSRFITDDEVR